MTVWNRLFPWLELLVVGGATGVSAFWARGYEGVLILALAFWPLRRVVQGRWSVRTPLDPLMLPFLAVVAGTWWLSPRSETTHEQVYRVLLGIGLYYAVVNWAVNRPRLQWALRGVALLGLLLAAVSVLSLPYRPGNKVWTLPPTLLDEWARIQRLAPPLPDTANPNILAGYVLLFSALGVVLWLVVPGTMRWWEQGLGFVAWAVTTGMLLVLQSRGALVALGVALVLYGLLVHRVTRVAVLLGMAGGMGMALWGQRAYLSALAASPLITRALTSLMHREAIWQRGIYLVQTFPLTGVGMGLYKPVVDVLFPFFEYNLRDVPHAHNLFLQVAVDLGLPGALVWTAMWLALVACAWEVYRNGRKMAVRYWQVLGAGSLAFHVAFLVHGLTDAVPWAHTRPAPLLWALWGILAAA